jgi:aspartate carbamoyltransferase catalytic subunit
MGTTHIAPTLSEASRSLIGIDRLSAADIVSLMHGARRNSNCPVASFPGFAVCLLILQPALRTRLGFPEVAARLGGGAHVITFSAPDRQCIGP